MGAPPPRSLARRCTAQRLTRAGVRRCGVLPTGGRRSRLCRHKHKHWHWHCPVNPYCIQSPRQPRQWPHRRGFFVRLSSSAKRLAQAPAPSVALAARADAKNPARRPGGGGALGAQPGAGRWPGAARAALPACVLAWLTWQLCPERQWRPWSWFPGWFPWWRRFPSCPWSGWQRPGWPFPARPRRC